MAHLSRVMRRRITELLVSAACQRIDFRWGTERIMGAQYSALAISLNGTSPQRLREEVGHVDGGLARYIIERNTIRLPTEGFGLGSSEYAAYERMSVVHECTHAVFDMAQRHATINALSNEIMAYIAGALFNLNAGRPYRNASDQLWIISDRIAAAIPPGGGVIGPDADVLALRQIILADPTYTHLRQNPRRHNDGVAL